MIVIGITPYCQEYVPDQVPVTSTLGGMFAEGAELVVLHPIRSRHATTSSERSVVIGLSPSP